MKKRGQVTIFIVLGIIVLVVFGLLFALKIDFVEDLFGGESGRQFDSVDIEAVKDSISFCVSLFGGDLFSDFSPSFLFVRLNQFNLLSLG